MLAGRMTLAGWGFAVKSTDYQVADIVPAQEEVGSFVGRLPRALEAALQQMAGPEAQGGAADPQAEERRKQAEGALRAMVAQAERVNFVTHETAQRGVHHAVPLDGRLARE